jgi:hypothetical protein
MIASVSCRLIVLSPCVHPPRPPSLTPTSTLSPSSSLSLQFGTPGEQLQLPEATPEGLAPEELAPRTTQRLRTGSAGLASQLEQVRVASGGSGYACTTDHLPKRGMHIIAMDPTRS